MVEQELPKLKTRVRFPSPAPTLSDVALPDFLNALDRAALEERGITGWSYGLFDQVRFYELDALAHVNNVAYLRWFETIRVRYIQHYGLTSYTDADPQLVVRAQTADYLAPMFQDQHYVVAARTRLLKATSFIMEYAVYAGDRVTAKGDAVCISLEQDAKTRRPHYPEALARIRAADAPEEA